VLCWCPTLALRIISARTQRARLQAGQ
jgi:hypothetical protein